VNFLFRCLSRLGINIPQYRALLRLFRTLADREEFEVGDSRLSRYLIVGAFALFIAIANFVVTFTSMPLLRSFVLANFAVTALLVFITLLTDAVNTFLNPVEASVLAHQPVPERTYFAAKLTHLVAVVGSITLPLNLVPALLGLRVAGTRWFYPLTHLFSVYLLGVFVALVLCAIVGILFRLIPLSRLRSLAATAQVLIIVLLFVGPRLARLVRSASLRVPPALAAANPLDVFVWLARIGQGNGAEAHWPLLLSVMLSAVFVMYGIRSLSSGYLVNVHLLLRSGPTTRRAKRQWFGRVIRRVTGKPSGRAAFSFMYAMARTDWQFRRSVLPLLVQFLSLPVLTLIRGLGASPFGGTRPHPMHFLPHIPALAGLAICSMLTFFRPASRRLDFFDRAAGWHSLIRTRHFLGPVGSVQRRVGRTAADLHLELGRARRLAVRVVQHFDRHTVRQRRVVSGQRPAVREPTTTQQQFPRRPPGHRRHYSGSVDRWTPVAVHLPGAVCHDRCQSGFCRSRVSRGEGLA
jgi:hypothetical protein